MKFDHTKITFGRHIQEHVKTAAGHRVTLLVRTFLNGLEVIVGVIHQEDIGSWVSTWNLDGTKTGGEGSPRYNLVMSGPKRKLAGWMNVYCDGDVFTKLYRSREEARESAFPNAIACIHHEIEYEEGEGL